MVNVSQRKVKEAVLDRVFWLFFQTVGNKKNRRDFDSIIKEILTPAERIMIAKRIALMYLLIKGVQRDVIYETLKVSRTTISNYVLLLDHNEELKKTLQRLARREQIKDIFIEFLSELHGAGTYGVNWSSAWKRKKLLQEKKLRGI